MHSLGHEGFSERALEAFKNERSFDAVAKITTATTTRTPYDWELSDDPLVRHQDSRLSDDEYLDSLGQIPADFNPRF